MFLRQSVPGVPPTVGENLKKKNYFLQSEAFCDHFHDILKFNFLKNSKK